MKKFIALLLTVILTATVAVGGTVAYLRHEDSDVNVMTLGNVKIDQKEYQRVKDAAGNYTTITKDNVTSYELEEFDKGAVKMLLPCTEIDANGNPYNHGAGTWDSTTVRMTQVGSYGGMTVFESPNAQDKFVVVTNEGTVDAYVRTIVAIEHGTADAALIGKSHRGTTDAADAGEGTPWFQNIVGTVEIDGTNYYVIEFVYEGAKTSSGYKHENGVLPAGQTTYPSLCQVYLTSDATNDDMVKIAGDNNQMDILVLSQAVQANTWTAAAGKTAAQTALDVAFGEVNATNLNTWFAPKTPTPTP